MTAIETIVALRVLAIEAAAGHRLALACSRSTEIVDFLDRDRGLREAVILALSGRGSAIDALALLDAARARTR